MLYLTMTCPDLSFTVQVLSQYMSNPRRSHLRAAMNVIKYLKKDPSRGIFFPSYGQMELEGYCDSDWGSCADTHRSITGFLIKLGGAPIAWKSKRQNTVSRSYIEAEYKARGSIVSEITWLSGLLQDLCEISSMPVVIYCDSKAAIQIASNLVFHKRTKHIDRLPLCEGEVAVRLNHNSIYIFS